ncbi:MAG TPA: hypothetical protein VME70_05120 [Mycobacteriales bacterium]|nr:hypothetical protein [Mycobacteriales bacterium]
MIFVLATIRLGVLRDTPRWVVADAKTGSAPNRDDVRRPSFNPSTDPGEHHPSSA